jgi:hypothetical protein
MEPIRASEIIAGKHPHVIRHMTDNAAFFRKQAADAQTHANRAVSAADRSAWLRLAQSWLTLLRSRDPTPSESFDDAVTARGTHQDVSQESQ